MKRFTEFNPGLLIFGKGAFALSLVCPSAFACFDVGYQESPFIRILELFDSTIFRVFALIMAVGAGICIWYSPSGICKRVFAIISLPWAIAAATSFLPHCLGISRELALIVWLLGSLAIVGFLLREPKGVIVAENYAPPSDGPSSSGHVDPVARTSSQE